MKAFPLNTIATRTASMAEPTMADAVAPRANTGVSGSCSSSRTATDSS